MVAAFVAGVVIGIAVAVLVVRGAGRPSRSDAPGRPAGDVAPEAADPLGPLLRSAIEQLDRAVIIVDAADDELYRNGAATALGGTHVGVLLDSAVDDAIDEARRCDRVERRIDLHGPPKASLLLVARVVTDGAVVVVMEDVSERERIEKMRTDFVANISHELKTPVGAIAVLADALLDEEDPEVVTRVASRIVEESGRAVTTIDALLELSRIEATPVSDEVIEVHEIVQTALARGRTVEPDKHVRLSAFEARDPIWIRGDRRQLASAVGNLVENAVKYSEPEGVVQVRTRTDDRWIEVMVADQGVGIPARDLGRIFERFYRVDRARSRATGGTGLGLSIVRRVATNHGGDVQVSSTEGEGSTFVLRLPIALVVDPPTGDTEPESDADATDHAVSEGT